MANNDKASWDRFRARLAAIPDSIKEECKPAIEKSANELAKKMKSNAAASKLTGRLIDSITVTLPEQSTPPYATAEGKATAGELEAIVTAGNEDVRYPHLVEYGTKNAPAQPFFWPSARELEKRIKGRLKRAVKKAVEDSK